MTPELWQRLKPLYEAALELSGAARDKFIAEACGNDDELLRELTALLRAHDEPTGPVDAPIVDLRKIFSPESSVFSPGDLIMGRFRIVRHIGDGGMGSVYEATDLEMGRIALKTIRADVAANPDILAHFKKEVLLARKVSGPNICRIHEWSGTDYKPAFLTMEFLEGVTLADKLRESGPFEWREAKPIALEICAGLQAIHDAGIIHRDLKCRNIMLTERNGRNCTVLMDFGLAREFTRTGVEGAAHSTRDGAIVGTPDYMAPEQFEGKELGPATDIYALGIVLYELVTGKHPYAASTPIEAAIHRARHLAPASAIQRQVPRNWDRIIDCCLEYEPARRYSSASEVARELRAGPANLGNLRKDRPWVLRLAAALALAGLAWFAFLWWQSRQYYRPSAEAHHWYNAGVAALREGSYLKATRLLTTAVSQDEQYAMAHARLAEAWADLDFDGNAQREMLIATAGERRLTPLDRQYMNAIRATLTHNFPEAVILYGRILHELPATEEPAGYVDLGMAEERAGNPQKALEDYGRAASLDKDNAAAYLHTAVLESRQHHLVEANYSFDRAEAIFRAEINAEGLAELDYERGYLANTGGDMPEAERYLNRALSQAQQMQNIQLEIRTLTQLSSVEFSLGHETQAVDLAKRSITLARDNQLNAWAANGLARLANIRLAQGSQFFGEAENAVQEAILLAERSQQLRAAALAKLTLASLRDLEDRPDDVVAPAQDALRYYLQNGFFEPAADASLLLIRSLESRGNYSEALQSANTLLTSAIHSGNNLLITQAEESVGNVLLHKENYPEALIHFQRGWATAPTENGKSYEALLCADTLSRLGHNTEADSMLASIPINSADEDLVTAFTKIRSLTLLRQQQFRQAATLIQKTVARYPGMAADEKATLQTGLIYAELHLGGVAETLAYLKQSDTGTGIGNKFSAEERVEIAEMYLLTGQTKKAALYAKAIEARFASASKLDSALRSSCIGLMAVTKLHENEEANNFSKRAVDIVAELQHTWGPEVFKTYLSRPDVHTLMRDLPQVRSFQ